MVIKSVDWKGIGVVFAICVVAFYYMGSSSSNVRSRSVEANKPVVEKRSGAYSENIGDQDKNFGSSNQASALLNVIRKTHGKASYNIQYITPVDVVIFGCDYDKNVIVRLHQKPDGHGTSEKWIGAIEERLENAARGGSLNDTSLGKREGSFLTF